MLLITLHAGTAFDNAQLFHDSRRMVHNLTTALSTRHTIGVAQGLLMRHLACDTDRAFTLLRRASQHTNHKLRDLAARLVTAHEQGNFHEALVDHRIHQDVQ
ncbi:ANTAR domain-containing protein [Actinosynnema sp. NPDC059335]|uniref:ANTAR domain-containing protein n=1 Tax=Actinosynnema sp. NPDC059335 TaxID=3346804 RepID=UPI00366DF911